MDSVPANRQELNSARISRYELVDIMFKHGWEDVVTGESLVPTRLQAMRMRGDRATMLTIGAFVRLITEDVDPMTRRPKYRAHRVIGTCPA